MLEKLTIRVPNQDSERVGLAPRPFTGGIWRIQTVFAP